MIYLKNLSFINKIQNKEKLLQKMVKVNILNYLMKLKSQNILLESLGTNNYKPKWFDYLR